MPEGRRVGRRGRAAASSGGVRRRRAARRGRCVGALGQGPSGALQRGLPGRLRGGGRRPPAVREPRQRAAACAASAAGGQRDRERPAGDEGARSVERLESSVGIERRAVPPVLAGRRRARGLRLMRRAERATARGCRNGLRPPGSLGDSCAAGAGPPPRGRDWPDARQVERRQGHKSVGVGVLESWLVRVNGNQRFGSPLLEVVSSSRLRGIVENRERAVVSRRVTERSLHRFRCNSQPV